MAPKQEVPARRRYTTEEPVSGTEETPVQLLMVLSSIVTAPLIASARPQSIVAPVFSVMLWSAMMFPAKSVLVPTVAELPIAQQTLSFVPILSKRTDEALAVVSVL